MVSIGALRYDIIADTTKFSRGMVNARSQLNQAKRAFLDSRTDVEMYSLKIEQLTALWRTGALSSANYARAVATSGVGINSAVAEHQRLIATLRAEESAMTDVWVNTRTMGTAAQRAHVQEIRNTIGAINQEILTLRRQEEAERRTAVTIQRTAHAERLRAESVRRGQQVTQQMLTPMQRYQQELRELDRLLRRGAISQDTYNRAQVRAISARHAGAAGGGGVGGASRLGMLGGTAASMAGFAAAYGAVRTVSSSLSLASEIEASQAMFNTMTGSAKDGIALMKELREFDLKTTFSFSETAKAAQKLLGFGIAANEIEPTISRLGDVSRGNAEALDGLTLAYGQVATKGRLQMEEVNQMIERGFNPLRLIMERTGETGSELSDRMQKGKVSFEELKQAVIDATNAGGQFFGLMEARSKTTAGQFDLMRGEWQMLKIELGQALMPAAGGAIAVTRDTLKNISGGVGGLEANAAPRTQEEKSVVADFFEHRFNQLLGGLTGVDTIGDTFGTMKTSDQRRAEEAAVARQKAADDAKAATDLARKNSEQGFMVAKGIFDNAAVGVASFISEAPSKILDGLSAVQSQAGSLFGTVDWLNNIQNQGRSAAELRKPAPVELSPSARRGSREEYALIAKMTASKANDAEARRHNELIKKQDEQIDLWDTAVGYLGTLANAAGGAV